MTDSSYASPSVSCLNNMAGVDSVDSNILGIVNLNLSPRLENDNSGNSIFNISFPELSATSDQQSLPFPPLTTLEMKSPEFNIEDEISHINSMAQHEKRLQEQYQLLQKQQDESLILPLCSLQLQQQEQEQIESLTDYWMPDSELSELLGTTEELYLSTSDAATSPNVAMSMMTALQLQSAQLNVQNNLPTITEVNEEDIYTTLTENQQRQYDQQQQMEHRFLHSPFSPILINTLSPPRNQQQQQLQDTSSSSMSLITSDQQSLTPSNISISTNEEMSLMEMLQMQITEFNEQSDQQEYHQQQQYESLPTSSSQRILLIATQQQQQQQLQPQQEQNVYISPTKSKVVQTPLTPTKLSSPSKSKILARSPQSTSPRSYERRINRLCLENKYRFNTHRIDDLRSLIPNLDQNTKLSKSLILEKGITYIKRLHYVNDFLRKHISAMNIEREDLNKSLTHLYSSLPLDKESVTRQGMEYMKKRYEQYVRSRAQEDWKFWLLGLILEPILASYNCTVASSNPIGLKSTANMWVDHCYSLNHLRPSMFNKLRYLAMSTNLLSDPPSILQEEIEKALKNTGNEHPNLFGV